MTALLAACCPHLKRALVAAGCRPIGPAMAVSRPSSRSQGTALLSGAGWHGFLLHVSNPCSRSPGWRPPGSPAPPGASSCSPASSWARRQERRPCAVATPSSLSRRRTARSSPIAPAPACRRCSAPRVWWTAARPPPASSPRALLEPAVTLPNPHVSIRLSSKVAYLYFGEYQHVAVWRVPNARARRTVRHLMGHSPAPVPAVPWTVV